MPSRNAIIFAGKSLQRPHLCFLRCHAFLCAVRRMDKVHSPNFLQEHRGAPRSTPRLLSFHEESNQRRAKEEVSSLETPLRGTSPRELRKAKFSPPNCSAGRQTSGFAPTASGSKRLRRCIFYPRSGVSKGACPFRRNSKNQEVFGVLFVKLSSHKKVSAGVGRVGPQIGSAGTSLQKTLQKVRRRSTALLMPAPAKG